MLDAETARLTNFGTVTVKKGQIEVSGFDGRNTSCREVAVLAALWAIGELQRELMKTPERPGGGNIGID